MAAQDHSVYRIDTYDTKNNAYGINRDEHWTIRLDQSFATRVEAEQYVKDRSRIFTEVARFLIDCKSEQDKQNFLDEFCFTDDKYLKYRRFFVGFPPEQRIREALRADGVQIVS